MEDSALSLANTALQTPLHLAARNGLVPVVQELIARGGNLLAEDEDGHNPALACAPNPQVADCLALILVAMVPSLGSPMATSERLEKTEDNLEDDTIDYAKPTHNATV
ncbi:serine/threonine-protein phosphatase 6 regulatory ankyrin repeat subunit A-like [Orbicella faveolata]|nr:serine/threonine-protein phosphatase 6 regulatory ankyrin repeat subunit A-like [Orbicella faveolata]